MSERHHQAGVHIKRLTRRMADLIQMPEDGLWVLQKEDNAMWFWKNTVIGGSMFEECHFFDFEPKPKTCPNGTQYLPARVRKVKIDMLNSILREIAMTAIKATG